MWQHWTTQKWHERGQRHPETHINKHRSSTQRLSSCCGAFVWSNYKETWLTSWSECKHCKEITVWASVSKFNKRFYSFVLVFLQVLLSPPCGKGSRKCCRVYHNLASHINHRVFVLCSWDEMNGDVLIFRRNVSTVFSCVSEVRICHTTRNFWTRLPGIVFFFFNSTRPSLLPLDKGHTLKTGIEKLNTWINKEMDK